MTKIYWQAHNKPTTHLGLNIKNNFNVVHHSVASNRCSTHLGTIFQQYT